MHFKSIALTLMFIASLMGCTSKQNDLKKVNLKGKVWKVWISRYQGLEKFGQYELGDKLPLGNQCYIYNEAGNLTELQDLSWDGGIEKRAKYSYDQEGNCTEIRTYADGLLVLQEVKQTENNHITESTLFDEKGDLIEKYIFSYSGPKIAGAMLYDQQGDLVMSIQNEWSGDELLKQIVQDSLQEVSITYA